MTYTTKSQSSRPGGSWADPFPIDDGQHLEVLDALTGDRNGTLAMLNEGRWPEGDAAGGPGRPVLLAQAGTGIMNDFGPTFGPLPHPGRLARGAGLLGAAALMNEVQRSAERAQVEDAMHRFGLSGTSSADILAARAYVWARAIAPVVFWSVPYSGPINERVARAIMQHERDNPGTLGLATRGDRSATAAIEAIVKSAIVGTPLTGPIVLERRRSTVADPALSTDSVTARTALGIRTNQSWIAHHLIPFAVMASLPQAEQQSIAASGWTMDSLENLIALPRNFPTYIGPVNRSVTGQPILPWHAGAHIQYSAEVLVRLRTSALPFPNNPGIIRPALAMLESSLRQELVSRRSGPGRWHQMLP